MTPTIDPHSLSIPFPQNYQQVSHNNVSVDGTTQTLIRFERADGHNNGLGGEHISLILGENNRLQGITRMTADLADGTLPNNDEAQEIALRFLQKQAPDLIANMKLSWVDPHDETILLVDETGKKTPVTLTGMKVKMQNTADKRWFWVVVGKDKEVMVFERDIVWITMPGHRQTEKWLHDSWLQERMASQK